MQNILVPNLGESISEGTIKSFSKRVGEYIGQDEVIALLETDKVTIEITTPCAGVVHSLQFKEGDIVTPGKVIALIDPAGKLSITPATPNAEQAAQASSSESLKEVANSGKQDSPAAKVLMQEAHLHRAEIPFTGRDGRVTKEDVLKFTESKSSSMLNPAPAETLARTSLVSSTACDKVTKLNRGERVQPMSKLRQRIAQRLKDSQNNAAILTTFNEVNMSNVIAIRAKYKDAFEKKYAVKLGFMSFFVRASILALMEIPAINAEIRGSDIIFKDYFDIGVAVSTENGLLVPVIRNSEELSLAEIERSIADLGLKAREGKISVKDMEGGTFTITNGGIYGSLMSTPILNPPQSGILGMHAIQKRPMVMENGEIKACPMMYLALSYDHRIVDGREAVTFLVRIKDYIESPERLLLNV